MLVDLPEEMSADADFALAADHRCRRRCATRCSTGCGSLPRGRCAASGAGHGPCRRWRSRAFHGATAGAAGERGRRTAGSAGALMPAALPGVDLVLNIDLVLASTSRYRAELLRRLTPPSARSRRWWTKAGTDEAPEALAAPGTGQEPGSRRDDPARPGHRFGPGGGPKAPACSASPAAPRRPTPSSPRAAGASALPHSPGAGGYRTVPWCTATALDITRVRFRSLDAAGRSPATWRANSRWTALAVSRWKDSASACSSVDSSDPSASSACR